MEGFREYSQSMGSKRNGKVVSKYHRLRLTDDIRKLVLGLPVVNLRETQVGNHVYMADGEICIGLQKRSVRIRIAHRDGRLSLIIRSADGLDLELPYDTSEQRDQAPVDAKEKMQAMLN